VAVGDKATKGWVPKMTPEQIREKTIELLRVYEAAKWNGLTSGTSWEDAIKAAEEFILSVQATQKEADALICDELAEKYSSPTDIRDIDSRRNLVFAAKKIRGEIAAEIRRGA
jgi:hypothetical protein